ncbi:MAG TPA: c-type cytochrome [Methylocella sp.]|nr:c-type cytochrome [Methylocella sp.]
MDLLKPHSNFLRAGPLAAALLGLAQGFACAETPAGPASAQGCAAGDAGIKLPHGFCATVFADGIGHARHLAVSPSGTVYVNTWSGSYYKTKPPPGGFLVALKDTDGDGRADIIARFGETEDKGGQGGTGIAIFQNNLFAESSGRIVRYALNEGQIAPKGEPETAVSGLPLTGEHPMHPFAISGNGEIFVNMGAATNSCQLNNRMRESPGEQPCRELETHGGIWRYSATALNQTFSPRERFATGLRNAEGIAFDPSGRIFVTQHGRDLLAQNWPRLYRPEQGQNLPAEELVELREGADYGWPYCYYDGQQNKLLLAPEYGGDGRMEGICPQKQPPVAAYPAHWAPNDLKFYDGAQFPAAYRGGAFIAFHGSWNRAPGPQGGYNVVFQPFSGGKPSGPFIVFADCFAGAVKEPGRAAHRPSGLAIGPEGALYISDDIGGRIWRVTYQGDKEAPLETVTAAGTDGGTEPGNANLQVPRGMKPEQVALGRRIFQGEIAGAACTGCHGLDGKGSPLGPDLTSGKWLWGDGSLKAITAAIADGIPQPKEHPGVMPPMGGAQLSPEELAAVAAYVWALGHAGQP